MAKACASQGAPKTEAPSSPRGIGATAAAARLRASGRLKVAFPGVDRDHEARIRLLAPELRPGEADRIKPLRALALPMRIRIREHEDPVHALDEAALAAGAARQPGLSRRQQ